MDRPLSSTVTEISPHVSPSAPVAVIGAGPHGLSAVAHLRDAGVPAVAFGDAMAFWRDTMPRAMLLRSPLRASSISSPRHELSLARWAATKGCELRNPLPVEDFIEYGMWFTQRAVPDLDARSVTRLQAGEDGFELTLSDGERIRAGRVVVAAGIAPFAYTPPVFDGVDAALVSHASSAPDMATFARKSVAVVGLGQSALEGAAIAHEAGARVEVIGRRAGIVWLGEWSDGSPDGGAHAPAVPSVEKPPKETWRERTGLHWRRAPTGVGGRFSSWLGAAPDVVRVLPRAARGSVTSRCLLPAGAQWLPDRLREVDISLSRAVVSAREHGGQLQLSLDDGSERAVDHVLLGTGYRIEVGRYPFLSSELTSRLRARGGSPLLSTGLESSIAGLHFLGAPAVESFGPVMRFVVGTEYAGPAVTQHIRGRRLPAFRWSF
jgi:FAD-dependent urate hydroxylase